MRMKIRVFGVLEKGDRRKMKNVPTKYTLPKKKKNTHTHTHTDTHTHKHTHTHTHTHTHMVNILHQNFSQSEFISFLAGLAIHATNPLSSCFGFYSKKKLPLCEAKSQTR